MSKVADQIVESNLEDMIRAAAKNGELSHLSLAPVAGKGPGNIAWAASYSPASIWANGYGNDIDPVVAIKKAMTDVRIREVLASLRKTLGAAGSLPHVKEETKAAARKALADIPPEVDDGDFV